MTRFRTLLRAGLLTLLAFLIPLAASAAPFAAFVMDGRTGKQIYAQNADTRLYPASLTKMMTLYLAFTAIERGQVRLDTKFTVSPYAANEPPSRLGLRAGQKIELRYLIRAAAIKSANDAATVIGENLAGSEARFAAQMTGMARALGMNNTRFLNANGLTRSGHYSTARDMSILGRRLFYDFPQYYSIFSRRSADAGIATVRSTNRAFLNNYPGADGIKTGYTRAAGFNLTASAHRGSKRIVATVMGGTSTAQRNATMAKLLDMGFSRAPTRVKEIKPAPPQYIVERKSSRKIAEAPSSAPAAKPDSVASASLNSAMNKAMVAATIEPPLQRKQEYKAVRLSASNRPVVKPRRLAEGSSVSDAATDAVESTMRRPDENTSGLFTSAHPVASPRRRNSTVSRAAAAASTANIGVSASDNNLALESSDKPERRSETVILSSGSGNVPPEKPTERVSRVSSSGGQRWGVSLGRFKTHKQADDRLIQVSLQAGGYLDGALRQIQESSKGYEATLIGLSQKSAKQTCMRVDTQGLRCDVISP